MCTHTCAVLTNPLPFSITFAGGPGRDGIIDFTPGSELLITKAKNGHLAVVSGTWQATPASLLMALVWGGAFSSQGFFGTAWVPYHLFHPIAY